MAKKLIGKAQKVYKLARKNKDIKKKKSSFLKSALKYGAKTKK